MREYSYYEGSGLMVAGDYGDRSRILELDFDYDYLQCPITKTITTNSYGDVDVLINPQFYTTDGGLWRFTCGVYLKEPLLLASDKKMIEEVVTAIYDQVNFVVSVPQKGV